jgi:carboxymethylenebutenolidase
MNRHMTAVPTPDGPCPTHWFRPDTGGGPWPAAVFCIDGVGARPSLFEMADRIAQRGYLVAMPDLFHRVGSPFALLPAGSPHTVEAMVPVFADPVARERWRSRFFASATDPAHLREDIGAVLAALERRPDARARQVAVTGYCMGGNIALRLAALFSDRVVACASFHGSLLATEHPDSPHLGAPQIRARVYVAGAIDDPSFTDAMRERLERALADAAVDHVVETYPGAHHGFAVPDHPAYLKTAAARHDEALFALLARTLCAQ